MAGDGSRFKNTKAISALIGLHPSSNSQAHLYVAACMHKLAMLMFEVLR